MAVLDAMAEVAPHVQDDFDLQEGQMAEVELQDREENLVRAPGFRAKGRDCVGGAGPRTGLGERGRDVGIRQAVCSTRGLGWSIGFTAINRSAPIHQFRSVTRSIYM